MTAHPDDNAPELAVLDDQLKPLPSSPEKEPPAINKRLSDLYDQWVDKHVRIVNKTKDSAGRVRIGAHHGKTGIVRGVDPRAMIHVGRSGVDGDWLCIKLDSFDPTKPIGETGNIAYVYFEPHNVEVIR